MSRFSLPLSYGGHVAYGFDHIVGPFIEFYNDDGDLYFSRMYVKHRTFDCHKLAQALHNLEDADLIPAILRTRQHIRLLQLDRPI